MNKFNLPVAVIVLTAATANAQLIEPGGLAQINVNTGAGVLIAQNYQGIENFPNSGLGLQVWYSGSYLNPRMDETATTVNGFSYTFSTNAQPVELTSLDLGIDAGQTVNSGGPVTGSDCVSTIGITAAVQEVLFGGNLLDTGYQSVITGTLSGNGILSFSGQGSSTFQSYILRPDTNYALTVAISDVMTFTNAADVPSMGVTQEFNNVGTGISGSISFEAAPEPPAYAALAFGLLGLGCLRRRRK